jgi:acyl-CoA thioesterase FadM
MTLAVQPSTQVEARPRFEGSNICTWIGFKHVMYLVEEAVLDHLRRCGFTPRELYEKHGLAVEIVDSDVRILHALHMDDLVRTQVVRQPPDGTGELVLRTTSFVDRPAPVKAVTAVVRVVFRHGPDTVDTSDLPVELTPHTVARITRRPVPGNAVVAGRGAVGSGPVGAGPGGFPVPLEGNAIVWRWRIPYFYCHFSERMQHSGYLRLMEEVVDVFLAERGISIRTLLDGQRWIPVVPRARVELLQEAYLEEEIYTVFTVEDIFKDLTYTARMDCYVPRGGGLVQTATGRITHGYAEVLNRRDWRLVPFDAPTLAALRGTGPGPAATQEQEGPLWSP